MRPALEAEHRVVAIALGGHGGSVDDSNRLTYTAYDESPARADSFLAERRETRS